MTKAEFILDLYPRLSFLPPEEIEERLAFYLEMIEDRMDEGLSEEEAVAAVGSAEEIAAQAVADTPLTKIARQKIKSKRQLRTGEIVLLALGSPLWLSLLLTAAAAVLTVYLTLWTVVLSLWAVFVSLAGCALGGVLACIIFCTGGNAASGIVMLAAGLVCAGLSIFLFFGCRAAVKGLVLLTKKTAIRIKHRFIRRRNAQ